MGKCSPNPKCFYYKKNIFCFFFTSSCSSGSNASEWRHDERGDAIIIALNFFLFLMKKTREAKKPEVADPNVAGGSALALSLSPTRHSLCPQVVGSGGKSKVCAREKNDFKFPPLPNKITHTHNTSITIGLSALGPITFFQKKKIRKIKTTQKKQNHTHTKKRPPQKTNKYPTPPAK